MVKPLLRAFDHKTTSHFSRTAASNRGLAQSDRAAARQMMFER